MRARRLRSSNGVSDLSRALIKLPVSQRGVRRDIVCPKPIRHAVRILPSPQSQQACKIIPLRPAVVGHHRVVTAGSGHGSHHEIARVGRHVPRHRKRPILSSISYRYQRSRHGIAPPPSHGTQAHRVRRAALRGTTDASSSPAVHVAARHHRHEIAVPFFIRNLF